MYLYTPFTYPERVASLCTDDVISPKYLGHLWRVVAIEGSREGYAKVTVTPITPNLAVEVGDRVALTLRWAEEVTRYREQELPAGSLVY